MEENHYYPFGLKHTESLSRKDILFEKEKQSEICEKKVSSPTNPILVQNETVSNSGYQYKYNGKEWQDELNLNLYDYGARNYDPALGRWMNVDPLAEKRSSISGYNYVQNNPLARIDPDGKLDEWVKTEDNSYVWDDRVTDQASAVEHHGENAKHVGASATVQSVSGGEVLDSVNLNSDGTVTKNGTTLAQGSSESFTNAAGSSFQSRQTEGSFVGVGYNFALLGGFGLDIGLVMDAVGNSDFYINFNGNLGFGGGLRLNVGSVLPTGDNQFLTSDFAGNSSSYSIGVTTPILDASISPGGSINSNLHAVDKMNTSNFGKIDRGYRTEQSGFGKPGGFGVGAMYSYGTTKVFN